MKPTSEGATDVRHRSGLESVVRQTAQALVRHWAEASDGRRGSRSNHAPTSSIPQRSPGSTSPRPDATSSAHQQHNALPDDLMGLVIPSRWDAALRAHDEAFERAPDARRVAYWFPRGGPPLTWALPDPQRTPDHVETMVHTGPPMPPDPIVATSHPTGDEAPTYGLSIEELQYFGMLPTSGSKEGKHSQTPKALLMERLRAAPRNVLAAPPGTASSRGGGGGGGSPQRRTTASPSCARASPPQPDAVLRTRANTASIGGVVIRSTRRVVDEAEGSDDAHADTSPKSIVNSSGSPKHPVHGIARTPSRERHRGLTLLAGVEKPINLRFLQNGHCDATHISSMAHMLALTKAVMSERAALLAGRSLAHPIHSIDCSGTRLGKHGRFCVPTAFHADGKPLWVERRQVEVTQLASIEAAAFWPDERLALIQRSDPALPLSGDVAVQTCLNNVSERSLALAYVVPLLYLSRPALFSITVLIARSCDLGDADAEGLAVVLRAPSANSRNKTQFQCVLERVDLSKNHITDVGAGALKKAIKYAPTLRDLSLKENPISNADGVLNEIKRRLRNNKQGISNLGPLAFLR